MQITRRGFTLGASALLGTGLVSRRARASVSLGGMQVEMVSDGNLVLPLDFSLGRMPEGASEILARYGIEGEALTPPCNITLLRHEDRVILFDVGSGSDFQPSAGLLPETLDTLGVAPEEITHLVITHGHPDHIWGLLDDFDEPFLPEAQIFMGRSEFDYWRDPNTVSTIDPARQSFAVGAERRLSAVADLVTFFEDGEEILPGILARMTPGHTPGHMSFELRDGSESLMVVGDAIGNHHVGFERPEWETSSDQDPTLGATTRAALLDQLASSQMMLAGFHLPGGLGRAERSGDGYRFVPA
ncbi:MBL fold metallo-hydrolase [Pararhodobacter sp. CCB-MM2]|uniref:MBL fold metallo-hydrolase n=1 Tax=Pararhodobacter sp. CCB-MM2 TaxID=1786003 RepID=UPI00082CDA18|nr:MBL fold metallo-hydrolase [Pararhodobacter sp. CCB-MM2]MCA2010587.1 MBL fold metallo-hydrolase [Cereibacter sphaeroides]